MIKVAHIITGLDPDGAERMLHRLVAGMNPARVTNEVISLTSLGSLAFEIAACGISVRALGMRRILPNPYQLLRLAHWLRHSRPHVIQTWMYHANLAGGLSAALAGFSEVVWNIRHSELDPRLDKRRTVWTARACARLSRRLPQRIICCSESSRRAHVNLGYASDRIEVIPNGCDLRAFRPDPDYRRAVRAELRIPRDAPLIGLIARFHPIKDHRTFIEAAARLHQHLPAAQFVLCGKDADANNSELVRWIESANIKQAFHLLGWRQDMPRIINALDIAASSSLSEAFPNVVAEAMSCGIPCVVTDVGDSALLVANTGRVVPPRNPQALARALFDLLQAPREARAHLGDAARQRVEEHFSIVSVIERYQNLYTQLAADASHRLSCSRLAQQPQ